MKKMTISHQEVSIRSAQEADAGGLSEFAAKTFSETYAAIIPVDTLAAYVAKEFSPRQMASDIVAPNIFLFLAVISDAIGGYIKLQPNPLPETLALVKPIELVRLYISQQWQGHGMGTVLIKAGVEAAVRNGFETCWLKVWEGNHRAIAFYEHKGFRRFGDESYRVGDVCRHVFVMSRPLSIP